MKRNSRWLQGASLLVTLTILVGATSCGTILYPERRGQAAGRIDAGVAVLDGIGLLFFLVPGVIAFAVDFATGAIYLPTEKTEHPLDLRTLHDTAVIRAGPKALTRVEIEAVVAGATGLPVDLASPRVRVARYAPSDYVAWGSMADVLTQAQLLAFENTR